MVKKINETFSDSKGYTYEQAIIIASDAIERMRAVPGILSININLQSINGKNFTIRNTSIYKDS